jgi:hypothetical protein
MFSVSLFNSKSTSGADQSDRTSLITSSSHSKASEAWWAKATVLSASGVNARSQKASQSPITSSLCSENEPCMSTIRISDRRSSRRTIVGSQESRTVRRQLEINRADRRSDLGVVVPESFICTSKAGHGNDRVWKAWKAIKPASHPSQLCLPIAAPLDGPPLWLLRRPFR